MRTLVRVGTLSIWAGVHVTCHVMISVMMGNFKQRIELVNPRPRKPRATNYDIQSIVIGVLIYNPSVKQRWSHELRDLCLHCLIAFCGPLLTRSAHLEHIRASAD